MPKVTEEVELKLNSEDLDNGLQKSIEEAKVFDAIIAKASESLRDFTKKSKGFLSTEEYAEAVKNLKSLNDSFNSVADADAALDKIDDSIRDIINSLNAIDPASEEFRNLSGVLAMQIGLLKDYRSHYSKVFLGSEDVLDQEHIEGVLNNADKAIEEYMTKLQEAYTKTRDVHLLENVVNVNDVNELLNNGAIAKEGLEGFVKEHTDLIQELVESSKADLQSPDIDTAMIEDDLSKLDSVKNRLISAREELKELNSVGLVDPAISTSLSTQINELMHKYLELKGVSMQTFEEQRQEAYKTSEEVVDLNKAYLEEFGITKDLADAIDNFKEKAKALREEQEQAAKTDAYNGMTQQMDELGEKIRDIEARYKQAFELKDYNGIRQLGSELDQLRGKAANLATTVNSVGNLGFDVSAEKTKLDEYNKNLSSIASNAGKTLSTNLTNNIKQGLTKITSILRKSITSTFNFAKQAVSKYFGVLKSGFTNIFSYIKKSFSSVGSFGKSTFGSLSNLLGQFRGIIGLVGFGALIKNMYELSSSAVTNSKKMSNVFGDMTEDMRKWASEFASRFTLTAGQARSFATEFGTVLGNIGLDSNVKSEMAKNLTALSGDIASFYGKSLEESKELVKKIVTSNRGVIDSYRQLGIVVNNNTLGEFALAQGYKQAYSAMSEADKAVVRYNYLLSQTTNLQGNASTSAGNWTNQIRMLQANFKSLGGILGGLLIKVLYPIVTVLNQIVVSAVNAMNALGKIMGFDPVSLSELTGAGAGAIDDTAEALEDEAEAIDGVGEASKKAGENLQGFDKLNNMTTQSASGTSKTAGAGIDGGIDFDSYYENIADNNKANKITKFFDELWGLIGEKNWEGAGKHLAQGINQVTDSVNILLKNEKNYNKIKKLADNISYFFKGLLNIDTSKIGANIGAGVNLITFAIDELYNSLTAQNVLAGIGSKIENFFEGLSTEIDFKRLGRSMTTGMRTMMDIARGFFDSAEADGLSGKLSNNIKDFIGGAIDRLFGSGGAQEIGQNIASVLNFAFDLLSGLFDPTNAVKVGDAIVTILNTAITDLDESKLQSAASNILNTIGDIFRRVSNIDTDELSDKISGAINGAVDEGSLSNAASGLASGFFKLFELLGETIKKLNLTDIAGSILTGIGDAIKNNPGGAKYLGEALGIILGGTLVSNAASLGIQILSKALIDKLAANLAGSAASSSIGGAVGTAAGSSTATSAASTGLSSLGTALGYVLVYAIAAYVGFRIGNAIGDAIAEGLGKMSMDKINSEISDLSIDDMLIASQDNIKILEDLSNKYKDMASAQRAYIDAWGDVSTTDFNLKDDVQSLVALHDLKKEMLETVEAMKAYGVEVEGLDEAYEVLNKNTVTAITTSDAINEAMTLLGDGILDVEYAIQGYNNALVDSKAETHNASQTILDDLLTTLDATDELPQIGTNNSTSYIEGMTDTFNADTSVESTLDDLLRSAGEAGEQTSEIAGTDIANTLTESTVGTISTDTSVQTTLDDLLRQVNESAIGVAAEGAKDVGKNITDGINEGMNDSEKTNNLWSSIGNFCSNLINTFKTNLGIHSPSKVFRELTAFIPEGAALGIEDGENDALDAIEKFSDDLISKFDSKSINIREMLNLDGIDEVMSSARDRVKTSLQGLQSDVFVQPNFRRSELDAITAQGSTNAVLEQKLTNMASRMNMNNSSRQMTVSVYLDASNKLGDFIIDTVNGQVVRGGAF